MVKAQRRRCKQEEHFRTLLMNRSKAACVFFMSLRREVEKSATVRLAMLWSPWHISSMSPWTRSVCCVVAIACVSVAPDPFAPMHSLLASDYVHVAPPPDNPPRSGHRLHLSCPPTPPGRHVVASEFAVPRQQSDQVWLQVSTREPSCNLPMQVPRQPIRTCKDVYVLDVSSLSV